MATKSRTKSALVETLHDGQMYARKANGGHELPGVPGDVQGLRGQPPKRTRPAQGMTRYQITFTDRPDSKARYRAALKMMGAQDVRITESEAEATAPKPKKDNLPTSPEALAVAILFSRPASRPWSDDEIALFRKATKTGAFSPENMKLITKYYETERKKGDEGRHRRDLSTFLRNASGELDRAKASKPVNRSLEWLDSSTKIVPMTSPEEEEKIREAVREQAAAFRAKGVM